MTDGRLKVSDAWGDQLVTVDRSPFLIGRRDTNALQLSGSEVSREHAEIVEEGGTYLLRDRGSSYGTYVNGEAVTECELRSGDRIRLGRGGGADLVFLREGDEQPLTLDSTTSPQENLRQVADLLEQLRNLGSERLLHDVLALVIDATLEVSGAERGFVMLPNPAGDLTVTLARSHTGETLTERAKTSHTIPRDVFLTGQTQVVCDLSDADVAPDHPVTREFGIRHVICLPLTAVRVVDSSPASGEPDRIGVLYLDSRTQGSLVSTGTRTALETLAAEASLAIANAQLYRDKLEKIRLEQEIRLAAKLQQELMPTPLVRLPYLAAAATCLPCRAIGGDFFYYISETASAFKFTLGDVAGKGPPAALLSAMMLGMFRLASQGPQAEQDDSPVAVVSSINGAMCQRGVEARFVTLLCGMISSDGQLTYCNAGHNPPFVVSSAGVRRLETGGLIVGVLPETSYEQETVSLEPGAMIVAFSDGVTEAADASGEEFGEARLLETIERAGTADPQAVVDAVVDDVGAFTKNLAQGDDITVMAIRYLGDPTEVP